MTETITVEYITRSKIIPKRANRKQIIIKWSLIFGNLGYFSVFLTGILIALFIGPYGYNPYYNAISDLGWSYITPFPFLFDLKSYIGSFVLILTFFLIKKKIVYLYNFKDKNFRNPGISKNLIKVGVIFGIIGAIGYIFVAIFNLDRPGPNGLYHYLFAIVMFGSLITSISIFSFYIILFKVNISKIFMIFGLVMPGLSAVLWFLTGILLFEWFTLFSILGFLMPFQSRKIIQKILS